MVPRLTEQPLLRDSPSPAPSPCTVLKHSVNLSSVPCPCLQILKEPHTRTLRPSVGARGRLAAGRWRADSGEGKARRGTGRGVAVLLSFNPSRRSCPAAHQGGRPAWPKAGASLVTLLLLWWRLTELPRCHAECRFCFEAWHDEAVPTAPVPPDEQAAPACQGSTAGFACGVKQILLINGHQDQLRASWLGRRHQERPCHRGAVPGTEEAARGPSSSPLSAHAQLGSGLL
jgi:hypothetical protein